MMWSRSGLSVAAAEAIAPRSHSGVSGPEEDRSTQGQEWSASAAAAAPPRDEELQALEHALNANPFDFDTCLKLIERSKEDPARVSQYRERAATYCPTTEEFWTLWIEEEKEALSTFMVEETSSPETSCPEAAIAAERRIIQLYRCALAAVPTADLWVDYLKFLRGLCMTLTSRIPPTVGALHIRRASEHALRDVGLHTTEGPKVWAFYRHFEQMLLNTLLDDATLRCSVHSAPPATAAATSSPDPKVDAKAQQQVERVRAIYRRQFSLPLAGRQDLLDEYRLFEAELPEALRAAPEEASKIEALYELGTAEWEKRRQFEQDVMVPDGSRLEDLQDEKQQQLLQKLSEGWTKYVKFEKSENMGHNQTRVSATYHRACEDLGHIRADLWQAWAKWVILHMGDFGRAAAILNRAVRFHPTHCKLWCMLLTCQGYKRPENPERIRQTFFKATLGMNIEQRLEDIALLCPIAADAFVQNSRGVTRARSDDPGDQQAQTLPKSETVGSVALGSGTLSMETKEKLLPTETHKSPGPWFSSPFARMSSPLSSSATTTPSPLDFSETVREIFKHGDALLRKKHFPDTLTSPDHSPRIDSDDGVDMKALKTQAHRTFLKENAFAEAEAMGARNALCHLWRHWMRMEAVTLKNFPATLRLARKLLLCLPPTGAEVNVSGSDWACAVEALSAAASERRHVEEARAFIAQGQTIVKEKRSYFLLCWSAFEKLHGDEAAVNAVQALLEANQDEEHRTADDEELHGVPPAGAAGALSPTATGIHTQLDPPGRLTQDTLLLTPPTTNLVRVTLEQLRVRREKRRRRLSESESDAGFSDASSDSGSVASCCVGPSMILGPASAPNAFGGCKKHRATTTTTHHLMDQTTTTTTTTPSSPVATPLTDAAQPSSSTFSGSVSSFGKPFLSDAFVLPTQSFELTPGEIQSIERLARSTWDGHECHDPTTAPPIAPITSCISLSGSSTSSSVLSRTSDVQCPCPPALSFLDTGSQAVSPPRQQCSRRTHDDANDHETSEDNTEPNKRARREEPKDDEGIDDPNSSSACHEDEPMVHHSLTKQPKKGKHFLQQHFDAVTNDPATELLGTIKQSSTVYVANLDWTVQEDTITALFADCSGLKEVRLVRDFRRRSKGFCYVDFETPELAEAAVDKKKDSVLHGRQLKIAISTPSAPIYEPTTLFASGIPSSFLQTESTADEPFTLETRLASTIEAAALRALNKSLRVRGVRLAKDSASGAYKGYGYIDFCSREDTAEALKIPSSELVFPESGETFTLAPSIPMKQHRWILAPPNKELKAQDALRAAQERERPKTEPDVLFVKNLDFKTSEDTLRDYFSSVGPVESVVLCKNENGSSKGFGFVKFQSARDAFSGLMLNDTTLDGREIVVSISHRIPTLPKPKEFKPSLEKHPPFRDGPKPRLGGSWGGSARGNEEAQGATASTTASDATKPPVQPKTNEEFRRAFFNMTSTP